MPVVWEQYPGMMAFGLEILFLLCLNMEQRV